NARALLFPIDWPEPFGLVMIEALACGTPVIAWRNGSVPEGIDDGVTGLVVDDIDGAVRAGGRGPGLCRGPGAQGVGERGAAPRGWPATTWTITVRWSAGWRRQGDAAASSVSGIGNFHGGRRGRDGPASDQPRRGPPAPHPRRRERGGRTDAGAQAR